MRPRFSIRKLLVLTGLLAAACYWWVARPTIVAEQFVSAVNSNDQVAAKAMYIDARQFDHWIWNMRQPTYPRPTLSIEESATPQPLRRVEAVLKSRTWHDLWRGQRRIVLRSVLTEEDNKWLSSQSSGAMPFPPLSYELVASVSRVRPLQ
jgi:hypothetical protein